MTSLPRMLDQTSMQYMTAYLSQNMMAGSSRHPWLGTYQNTHSSPFSRQINCSSPTGPCWPPIDGVDEEILNINETGWHAAGSCTQNNTCGGGAFPELQGFQCKGFNPEGQALGTAGRCASNAYDNMGYLTLDFTCQTAVCKVDGDCPVVSTADITLARFVRIECICHSRTEQKYIRDLSSSTHLAWWQPDILLLCTLANYAQGSVTAGHESWHG